MKTFEKLSAIIADVLSDIDPALIRPDARFKEDLGAHSMDIVEMLYRTEEEFDISTEDADLETMTRVGDIVAFIDHMLAA